MWWGSMYELTLFSIGQKAINMKSSVHFFSLPGRRPLQPGSQDSSSVTPNSSLLGSFVFEATTNRHQVVPAAGRVVGVTNPQGRHRGEF